MAQNNLVKLRETLKAPSVEAKFKEMLGNRAPQFMTSITSVVTNNALLQKADVNSIIMGAALAASMDLPLNSALGYVSLVPFNSKDGCYAQLQIQWKGLVELFLRSGQCQSIICETVYEGQLVKKNKFTGEYVFDEDAKKSDKIIGFMAYFKLTNGFEKFEYMTIDEIKEHAKKFSQTYRKGIGPWKDMFEQMAQKTVLKKLLTKWAPKSIEMQQMTMFDQSIVKGDINNMDAAEPVYADNGNDSKPTPIETTFVEAEVVETRPKDTVEDAPTAEQSSSETDGKLEF